MSEKSISSFELPFDLTNYETIDRKALLACQSTNLGNNNDWFGVFRGGLFGFYSRIYGLRRHYLELHAWLPRHREASEVDHHIASILFNMDSTIECLLFALNAFGYAIYPKYFRDISNRKELKQINPKDILGDTLFKKPILPISGYKKLFPRTQSYWVESLDLVSLVFTQHDVSKHRENTYSGGKCRLEPPEGFYESLGIGDDAELRAAYWPMAEIYLRKDPKEPHSKRKPQSQDETLLLESLVERFCKFTNKSGELLVQDISSDKELKNIK